MLDAFGLAVALGILHHADDRRSDLRGQLADVAAKRHCAGNAMQAETAEIASCSRKAPECKFDRGARVFYHCIKWPLGLRMLNICENLMLM